MVMLIGRQEAAIWHCRTIFCGTNQSQLRIWRPTFVMPMTRYNPIWSKKCTKIDPIEWGAVRQQYEWNDITFLTGTIVTFLFHCRFKLKLLYDLPYICLLYKLKVVSLHQTYIHKWSLQAISQYYWPSFSHHLCCVG